MSRQVPIGWGRFLEVEKGGRIRKLPADAKLRVATRKDSAGKAYSGREVYNSELDEWLPVDGMKIAYVRRYKPPKSVSSPLPETVDDKRS